MAMTTGDVIVQTLIDWGVNTIFGIPGDGVNGVIESLRKAQDKIRFIQTRHEEAAAFAAVGYAKTTGRLGVCLSTSGPGGVHLLNGLYDAKLDGQPVLAITGLQYHDLIGTHTQQDVALDKLFIDVSVFNERIMGAAAAQNITELAIRTALARRGVSHITIPTDIQDQALDKDMRSPRNKPNHVSNEFAIGARRPTQSELIDAAALLNDAKRVAILAGAGALGAHKQLEQVAETLGAPIIKSLLGKSCVPDDSPYTTGGIGLLGTLPSEQALEECDLLFIIGSSMPYIEFYPKAGAVKGVQIDIDPVRIALRFPIDAALVGDATQTLDALIPLLKAKNKSFLEKAQDRMKDWHELLKTRGTNPAYPMKPQVVGYELGKRMPANAIVVGDSGTNTTWWARYMPSLEGAHHTCSGNLATMAPALPYAIGAQVAHPNRPVIAFAGDGGLTMLLGELATCIKYKLPIKIVVIKNNTLGQIKWEQMVFLGNPEYVCDLQPIDFATVAKGFGMASVTIEHAEACGHLLENALATPGPVLIECVVDENEPPMPAKIKATQAVHFAESMARGTKDWQKIAQTVAKDRVRELI